LSVYTDGLNPSATRSVYTDGNITSVYTDRVADGVYSLSGNMQWRGDVRRFYRRNDRGIQTKISVQWCDTVTDKIINGSKPSVIPSEKPLYTHRSADTLFLCFSFFFFPIPPLPSQTAAPLPNCSHTHPNSPLFSTRALNIRTWSQYPYVVTISVSCRFYHFFVSKSILFSFNI